MRALIRTTLAVAALLLAPGSVALWPCAAAACGCSRADNDTLFRLSDQVVMARLARDQTGAEPTSVWITVEHREKGRDGARRLKVLRAVPGSLAECGCGARMPDDGRSYKFYLKRAPDQLGAYELYDARRYGRLY